MRSCFSTRIGLIYSTCTTRVSLLRVGGTGWPDELEVESASSGEPNLPDLNVPGQCLGRCTPPPPLSLSLSLFLVSNDNYIDNYLNDH